MEYDYGNEIKQLKRDNVTLAQISAELDYRDNAAPGTFWDDNLCEYATEELEAIEQIWDLV